MSSDSSSDGTVRGEPSDPGWAGTFAKDYWMFVRDGRWHIHDSFTGEVLGIIPLSEPLNIRYDEADTDGQGGDL